MRNCTYYGVLETNNTRHAEGTNMGTHATISVVNPDSTITQIYNHYDGYPAFLGHRLLESYNTEESARTLVEGGDISTVGKKGEAPRYYATRSTWDPSKAGDEPWGHVKPRVLTSQEGRLVNEEYAYLWEGGQWHVRARNGSQWFDVGTIM